MKFAMRTYGCALQAIDVLRSAGYANVFLEGPDHIVSVSTNEGLDELHAHQLVQAIDPQARVLADSD